MIDAIVNKIVSLPERAFRMALFYVYGFDKWHVNTLKGRKYANDIIRYLRSPGRLKRGVLVEIGCGLGDLLRNVDFEKRFGLDLDKNALKAARLLTKLTLQRSIAFDYFKFPETTLRLTADVLILVNWIHHIEPLVLKEKLEDYFNNNLTAEGEIIIDTVHDPLYKINHSIKFLTAHLDCQVVKIGEDVRNREIFSIQKIKK